MGAQPGPGPPDHRLLQPGPPGRHLDLQGRRRMDPQVSSTYFEQIVIFLSLLNLSNGFIDLGCWVLLCVYRRGVGIVLKGG